MVAYYRLPGVIANIALLIYALLTWAAFVLLGVTLTLPGIAGLRRSIGMAVDANVLIFERTREELRAGNALSIGRIGFLPRFFQHFRRQRNYANCLCCFVLVGRWFS